MRTLLLHTSLAVGLVLIGLSGCKNDDDDNPVVTAGAAGAETGGSGNAAGNPATGGTGNEAGGNTGGAGNAAGAPQGGASAGAPPTLSGTVEIFSWWTSEGEKQALDALITEFETTYPEVAVTNAAQALGTDARTVLETRLSESDPPDLFQENAGVNIARRASGGVVASLDDLDIAWTAIPPQVVNAITYNGVKYAVPVNIHRINSLFYNVSLMPTGFTPPTDLASFHALLEELKAGGTTPLALGNQYNWTMDLMVWEMVMPAVAGADFYTRFWTGGADMTEGGADDTALQNVLREALRLYCGIDNVADGELTAAAAATCPDDGYFNTDVMTVDWVPAVQMVVEGLAAMAPMGDWAKGTLMAAGMTPITEFDVMQYPGTDVFVWTADTFSMPQGAPSEENARAFLQVVASPEGQVAFNEVKGSIPVRTDIDPTLLDEMSQNVSAQFASATLATARSGLVPSGVMPDLAQTLRDALMAKDMSTVLTYVRTHYVELEPAP